jgi:hypothetical protein
MTTLRSLQATIQHLLNHEGATLDTPVLFYVDRELLDAPGVHGEPGPDGGRLVPINTLDQLSGPDNSKRVIIDRELE